MTETDAVKHRGGGDTDHGVGPPLAVYQQRDVPRLGGQEHARHRDAGAPCGTRERLTLTRGAQNDTLLPGLAGQGVNPTTGEFSSKYIVRRSVSVRAAPRAERRVAQSWGGASDSYFEYLIKYARLTNNADTLWVETWKTAVDSTLQTLAKVRPDGPQCEADAANSARLSATGS